jgi:hypothetical protein
VKDRPGRQAGATRKGLGHSVQWQVGSLHLPVSPTPAGNRVREGGNVVAARDLLWPTTPSPIPTWYLLTFTHWQHVKTHREGQTEPEPAAVLNP